MPPAVIQHACSAAADPPMCLPRHVVWKTAHLRSPLWLPPAAHLRLTAPSEPSVRPAKYPEPAGSFVLCRHLQQDWDDTVIIASGTGDVVPAKARTVRTQSGCRCFGALGHCQRDQGLAGGWAVCCCADAPWAGTCATGIWRCCCCCCGSLGHWRRCSSCLRRSRLSGHEDVS